MPPTLHRSIFFWLEGAKPSSYESFKSDLATSKKDLKIVDFSRNHDGFGGPKKTWDTQKM